MTAPDTDPLPTNPPPSADPLVAELAELAGGLAHELRNPLSTMMINLRLLSETLRDRTASEDDVRRRALQKVDVLQREAERLQSLFDDFLNLAGHFRLQPTPADLRQVIRQLVEFFEPLASGQQIELSVDMPDHPVAARVDERLLGQALLNLVINAQQAMPDGGHLRIALQTDGDTAELTVSDTGVGIAPEHQALVLRPFFSTKSGGTGLGLSITRRIVREHGGTLTLASRPGQGTIFTIRLPLTNT